MSYTIIKDYITIENRPGDALNYLGGVLHSTATPGASDQREQDYFEDAYRGASAHAFGDWDSITEIIPTNERAWHAGPTANSRFFGYEMCEPATYDVAKFREIWNRAVYYFAVKFIAKGIKYVTKDNLMSHKEVSAKWHETDHTDPVAFIGRYGKTVDMFRTEVQLKINSMLGSTPVASAPAEYTGKMQGIVTASSLKVRSTAEIREGNVIGSLIKGTKVTLGFKEGNWWNIYYGNTGGFVSADYVSIIESTRQVRTVTATSLKVRTGPGIGYGELGRLPNGTKVKIGFMTRNNWANIFYGDHGGYVSGDYLK